MTPPKEEAPKAQPVEQLKPYVLNAGDKKICAKRAKKTGKPQEVIEYLYCCEKNAKHALELEQELIEKLAWLGLEIVPTIQQLQNGALVPQKNLQPMNFEKWKEFKKQKTGIVTT